MSIRVLLADDHKILREGLRSLLSRKRGIEVVAEAGSGKSAIELARQYRPDIVIMDVTMPDLNGFEATRRILAEFPDIKVIALSMHADKQYLAKMFNAGAVGYLRKECASKELAQAIEIVLNGEIYLSPGIAGSSARLALERGALGKYLVGVLLSPKEREVLQMIAEGKPTKYIADQLKIGEKTVEKHRQHITEKLDLHSIAELTKYAIREGLTSIEK